MYSTCNFNDSSFNETYGEILFENCTPLKDPCWRPDLTQWPNWTPNPDLDTSGCDWATTTESGSTTAKSTTEGGATTTANVKKLILIPVY